MKETHKEKQQRIQKELNNAKIAQRNIVSRDCLKLLDSEAVIVRNMIRRLESKRSPSDES